MLPPVGGKFFSIFTLRLCRRDLRIPVCLLTGPYYILILIISLIDN